MGVVAVVMAASVAASAVPAGTASASSHRVKHRTCLQMFSPGRVGALTGYRMKLYGKKPIPVLGTRPWEYMEGSAAQVTTVGTVCVFKNASASPPSGWPAMVDAIVALGYAGKPGLWTRLENSYASGTGWFDGHMDFGGAYSKIKLPVRGSNAFLLTYDLWSYWQVTASTVSGNFPHYYYAVFAMSKQHDLVNVAFMGATLTQTKAAAVSVLKTSGF